MKKLIEINCKNCKKSFFVHPYRLKNGFLPCCSKKCAELQRITPKIKCKCIRCEKDFEVLVSMLKYRSLTFCSLSCSKQQEGNPMWRGESRETRPYLKRDGISQRKHRFIVEDFLGRKLKSSEIVHHIDKDWRNNKEDNFYLFRHSVAHLRWHAFLRRHKLDGKILESNLSLLCQQAA